MASPDEKIDVSSASFYALHVALQTLKERCHKLQERLTTVEDENELLRKAKGMDLPSEDNNEEYLRGMVGDLVRQKSQLTEHIGMVTKENRQLWSRLSKLTKENSSLGMSITKIRDAINSPAVQGASSRSSSNNLIRSKTFTRPNPKLLRTADAPAAAGSEREAEEENMSLEEISLQIINKLVEGKENFEQKCGEILETTTTDNLCFGFKGGKEVVDACEVANTIEKCTTEATVVKDALLQQQSRLKQLIQSLNDNKNPICNSCIKREAGKAADSAVQVKVKSVDSQTRNNDIIQLGADDNFLMKPTNRGGGGGVQETPMERTCPMCGKCYSKADDFEIFQRHVEWHFIDDNELDLSIDKNYDMISHTAAQNF